MKIDTRHTADTSLPLIRDLMQTHVISVQEDMSVEEVANILTQHHISGAPVVDARQEVVGVVSLADLAVQSSHPQTSARRDAADRRYYRDAWLEEQIPPGFVIEDYSATVKVKDVMTPIVHRVHEDDSVVDAVHLMLQARIHRLLVTNGTSIVGIVTTMDLISLIPKLLIARAEG